MTKRLASEELCGPAPRRQALERFMLPGSRNRKRTPVRRSFVQARCGLEVYEVLPEQEHEYTFIYMHALGGFHGGPKTITTPPRFFAMSQRWPKNMRLVVPMAPWRAMTFADGREMYAWFDYLSTSGGRHQDPIDESHLLHMRKSLHELIAQEAGLVGGHSRVFLGGMSQGCCMGLDAFVHYPEPLGGFCGLAGFVMDSTNEAAIRRSAQKETKIALFNGCNDRICRQGWVRPANQRLAAGGFDQVSNHFEKYVCHAIGGWEQWWILEFVREMCQVISDGEDTGSSQAASDFGSQTVSNNV
eukprot:CAMPEP_0204272904 /NCGR_PEP_ID=MMETSP0468-20130131/22350_1 /ASSEMBLY_ACC=CAM_ASM_000383 /TAXON_ID=2969 /ORGANISM="Oxyrrhis marina" /LENGTH=300 /DNA_ID=CAMNT_0051248805 /DNA_START=38 /DNA_END=940 /DNA_ORIENTATION=+